MKIYKNVVLMQIGVPTNGGRIYSESVVREAIEKLTNIPVLGEHGVASPTVNLANVSHAVTELRINTGCLIGTVSLLDTPQGKDLQKFTQKDFLELFYYSPNGYGVVNDDSGEVTDYALTSVSIVANG